jgi:acyl carrier protein
MTITAKVFSAIETVAMEQHKVLPPLTDSLPLEKTGFDSLCFAILVGRLEEDLGLDPFSSQTSLVFPVTVGDFVALYNQPKV